MQHKLINTMILTTFIPLAIPTFAQGLSTEQAVKQLHLTELAQTYSKAKIAKATDHKSQSSTDALMIDLGAIKVSDLNNQALRTKKLNHYVSDQLDSSENYLGNIRDEHIIERLKGEFKRAHILQDAKRLRELNTLIDKGYTTGYNVIDKNKQSHFDKKLTIRYGHNNLEHAVQLIDLMRTEGFDPKVQLVPKASAFLYLAKWGKSSYLVTTLASGKMVAISKEYNLDFEFKNKQRKVAFMDLINKYAKKNSKDQKGLISHAWWQPFYRSYTPMKNYKELDENRFDFGHYQAQLMVLHEKSASQAKHMRQILKSKKVTTIKTWVNPSFYRYMHGDYK